MVEPPVPTVDGGYRVGGHTQLHSRELGPESRTLFLCTGSSQVGAVGPLGSEQETEVPRSILKCKYQLRLAGQWTQGSSFLDALHLGWFTFL